MGFQNPAGSPTIFTASLPPVLRSGVEDRLRGFPAEFARVLRLPLFAGRPPRPPAAAPGVDVTTAKDRPC